MLIFNSSRPLIKRITFISPTILCCSIKTNKKSKLPSYPSESSDQLIKRFNNQGDYEQAFQLFDTLVKRNNFTIISLLNIINACAQSNNIIRGRQTERLINKSITWRDDIRVQTTLIKMYMKFQMIDEAERIFERIRQLPNCDVIVYNAMLKGYLQNHKAEYCFGYLDKMRPKISPDNVTYILLLNACATLRDEERGKIIHNQIISSSNVQHVRLQNALIDFYGKINKIDMAKEIFHQMNLRETSTYNSLMKAYLINNMPLEVLDLFEEMKQSKSNIIGPLGFKPDLITFMAICDACEKVGLLKSPESSYERYNWEGIFSKKNQQQ